MGAGATALLALLCVGIIAVSGHVSKVTLEHDRCATGEDKCVVSMSIYGSNLMYLIGATRAISYIKETYPGWLVYVYHDPQTSETILSGLRKYEPLVTLKSIDHPQQGTITGMFWRFLVANDPTVDRYIIRDADCRVGSRERAAVNDWINSGAQFHAMRDHPQHGVPMLGGMWGGVKGAIPKELLSDRFYRNDLTRYMLNKGGDQHYLAEVIWPFARHSSVQHDSYLCNQYPGSIPFPTQRQGSQFVGEIIRIEREEGGDFVLPHCPSFCRPPEHQDWLYC